MMVRKLNKFCVFDADTMKNQNNIDTSKQYDSNSPEIEKLLKLPETPLTPPSSPVTTVNQDIDEIFRTLPITEETSCGIWFLRGPILQRFANKKAYVFLYGVLGCIFSASYAYFNGTITTIEKRFKIPSKTTGSNDSFVVFDCVFFSGLRCLGFDIFFILFQV